MFSNHYSYNFNLIFPMKVRSSVCGKTQECLNGIWRPEEVKKRCWLKNLEPSNQLNVVVWASCIGSTLRCNMRFGNRRRCSTSSYPEDPLYIIDAVSNSNLNTFLVLNKWIMNGRHIFVCEVDYSCHHKYHKTVIQTAEEKSMWDLKRAVRNGERLSVDFCSLIYPRFVRESRHPFGTFPLRHKAAKKMQPTFAHKYTFAPVFRASKFCC